MSEDAGAEERARVQRAIDRIEERLHAAPAGLHAVGRAAEPGAVESATLPAGAAMVWAMWDGVELAGGESRLLPLSQVFAATHAADASGILRPGDRVIGEAGRDLFVLPGDPWAEGADVVRLEEDGTRLPEASSVAHLVLGLLAEIAVIYDEYGEFRDDLIGEDAELTPVAQRRLLRRRLDYDEDAPRPRLDLARLLRRAGEVRAARHELSAVLKRAPQWCWVHHELGHTHADEGQAQAAVRAHEKAAEYADEPSLAAYFLACAASLADPSARPAIAARVLAIRPEFAAEQERAASALLDDDNTAGASHVLTLGLAVAPRSLPLLALRQRCGER